MIMMMIIMIMMMMMIVIMAMMMAMIGDGHDMLWPLCLSSMITGF